MNINNIAEQILRKIPQGLSKLEQARFVYIELGKMVSYDEDYWYGNNKTKKRIYTSAQNVRDFKDIKDNKVICVSLSNLYNELMNKLGINAVQYRYEDDPHVYSILDIDGKQYKADLQRDLRYIQARRRTMFFCKMLYFVGENEKNEEELRKIDEKIGYTYEGEEEFEELIEGIKKNIELVEGIDQKILIILDALGRYPDIAKMGYIEKMGYYGGTFKKVLSDRERRGVGVNDMYMDKDGKRKYTCCISARRKDGTFGRMIYSENTGTFLPIEDEKIIELMRQGLKVVGNNRIPKLETNLSREETEDDELSMYE